MTSPLWPWLLMTPTGAALALTMLVGAECAVLSLVLLWPRKANR